MIKYWVWLSTCLDVGSCHLSPLLEKYKTPLTIYKTPISELKSSYILSPNELKRFNNKSLDRALDIIEQCNKSKITIIPFDHNSYPHRLKNIANPPACIYLKGKLQNFNSLPVVCVIGTRKISEYGKMVAWSLSGRLSAGGITILSGIATGGDTSAHEGAIAVGGKSISVLPCGINYDYPKSSLFLKNLITEKGCLISEFPPDTPLYKNAFQLRNRLLSAISLGVVIVEAPARSGTLITAGHALEQGRDVFVITGRPNDENYAGSNALLKDGAKPVFSADDIFNEYINLYPNIIDADRAKKTNLSMLYKVFNSPKAYSDNKKQKTLDVENENKKIKKNIDESLPKNVKMVYNCINTDLFTVDDLLTGGLAFEEVLSAVTQLELYGYIKAVPGGRYSIIY
jgi:DNA processing protein